MHPLSDPLAFLLDLDGACLTYVFSFCFFLFFSPAFSSTFRDPLLALLVLLA